MVVYMLSPLIPNSIFSLFLSFLLVSKPSLEEKIKTVFNTQKRK